MSKNESVRSDVTVPDRISIPDRELLSPGNIERYNEGCTEIAMLTHQVAERILASGQTPVILIPSRGAIPIFINGVSRLRDMDENNMFTKPSNVSYFPNNVFRGLSNERIKENGTAEDSRIKVVLYPFTADVSSEVGKDEILANQLRESSTRAFVHLLRKGYTLGESVDLDWYYFLMGKMKNMQGPQDEYDPSAIIESLKNMPDIQRPHVILIDTVISGRAASDITSAFKEIDLPITSVLAVDNLRGASRMQKPYKDKILNSIAYEYLGQDSPFITFPLISEDNGASLLGVTAVNVVNFNQKGFFARADSHFSENFMPQSCLWTLPPPPIRATYMQYFHSFLNRLDGEMEGWDETARNIHSLIARHGPIPHAELEKVMAVDQRATGKETSSHIVSITLSYEQAITWAREFAREQISRKNLSLKNN